MKFWQAFIRGRFPLAILAGIIWALAFPNSGIAGLAWIAPALLCFSAAGRRGWAAWRSGFVGGVTFYLVSIHWLLYMPVTGAPILGWIALSAYMALFSATWTWLCWRFLPAGLERQPPIRRKDAASLDHAGSETGVPAKNQSGWRSFVTSLQSASWSRRLGWTLACATAWVALEFISARLFSGFPWNLLGISQYRLTPLIQLASTTGVWGVSFMIVWFSVSLLCVASSVLAKPGTRSAWLPEIILPMLAVAAAFGVGFRQTTAPAPEKRRLKVALIQPSIPQTMIWNPDENARRFEALIHLTQQALTNQPDLLVWPEAAVPKRLRFHEPTASAVSELARTNRVWVILQSDDTEFRAGSNDPDEVDYFNSAFLINSRGDLAGNYRKQKLVIFGEYIPFVRWLPFLKWLAPIEDYEAGKNPVPFDLPEMGLRIAVLICFEDMFSQTARAAAQDDPDFLVNLTNDGWFGESSEQWQQAASAVFRAVENRRPVIRCTNNGLTCWIDEVGRIREQLDFTSRGIYGEGFLISTIEFANRNSRGTPTLYQRYGEWFAWLCLLLTATRLTALELTRRNHTKALVRSGRNQVET